MTIPFYTLNIIEPLQTMLHEANENGSWSEVVTFCEPLIESTQDDGVILCYTFAMMQEAIEIHVDEVETTAKTCLELLKRLNHTYGGTDNWKRMLKRAIKEAQKRKNTEINLINIDFEKLSTSQKSKLAYNLQDKGGVENCQRAAEIHLELSKIQSPETFYHTGNYIICLYKSNQIVLADEQMNLFSDLMKTQPNHGYAFIVGTCFQQKLVHYLSDKAELQQVWNEATTHPCTDMKNGFPFAYEIQDKLLIAADKFDLIEIKKHMIDLIVSERKPRMLSAEIKQMMGIQ